MNSTLGSVVPLAMFINAGQCGEQNVMGGLWWNGVRAKTCKAGWEKRDVSTTFFFFFFFEERALITDYDLTKVWMISHRDNQDQNDYVNLLITSVEKRCTPAPRSWGL